jgi:hypothetical protein
MGTDLSSRLRHPQLTSVEADEGFILDGNRLHGSGRIVHDVLLRVDRVKAC